MEPHSLIKVAQETTLLKISEKATGKIVEGCESGSAARWNWMASSRSDRAPCCSNLKAVGKLVDRSE